MKKYISKIIVAILGFTIIFISCTKSSISNSSDKNNFTGEELFKSILFGEGEFASSIPSLAKQSEMVSNMKPEDKKVLSNKLSILCNEIKKENSDFFNAFKNGICSGNQMEIKNSLEKASIELYRNGDVIFPGLKKIADDIDADAKSGLITTNGKIDYTKLESRMDFYKSNLNKNNKSLNNNFISSNGSEEQLACSWAVACVFYAALAVHNTVAVTVNIVAAGAVAVYLGVWFWGPGVDDNVEGKLKLEMTINEIAKAK